MDICVWGKLYKRENIIKIRYPKVSTHDDEFFTYKLLYASNRIINLDEKYYYYFMSTNSIMRKERLTMPLEYINAFEERKKFFIDKEEDELYKISCKEYAIRLMLSYMRYDDYKHVEYSKEKILEMFKLEYKEGKKNTSNLKEKISLTFFSIFPNFFSKICKLVRR